MIYPKGEVLWTSYFNSSHELTFIITSKSTRDYYYLYEAVNGEFIKRGRAKNPVDLEAKIQDILS